MHGTRIGTGPAAALLTAVIAVSAGGCGGLDKNFLPHFYDGETGKARAIAQSDMSTDQEDRAYMLDRIRLGLCLLADGLTSENDPVIEAIFEKLRQQGINDSKMVAAAVLNESIKFWKGEPFEQAMMFCYIGAHYAQYGVWDNCRAAVGNSLFQLKSFGTNDKGEPLDQEGVVRKAAAAESEKKDDYLEKGYTQVKSNFIPGYFLSAIANQVLGRKEESDDNYNECVKLDARLNGVVGEFKAGGYNIVLLVDFGPGPAKIAYGPDNALVKFHPRVPSDDAQLLASVDGGPARAYPLMLDMNKLSTHHMWNNLQDVRKAKSMIGSAMVAGGMAVAASSGDWRVQLAGLGIAAMGALTKASAAGDDRHCEIMPQRQYLVPVRLPGPNSTLTLQVDGKPYSKLVLTNVICPAPGKPPVLRYVRLVSPMPSRPQSAPEWATVGKLRYYNEYGGPAGGRNYPWILGGDCLRAPTQDVINSYHKSGTCRDMSLQDLVAIYKEEKIVLPDETGQTEKRGLHIVEGGDSLACPLPGTTGYMRLFCKQHAPYKPKGQLCKDAASRMGPSAPPAGGAQ